MDLEPCYKVHKLVVIQLNNTKLGQMTNLNMIFFMVVSIYKFDQICNSPMFPAQFQGGQLIISDSMFAYKEAEAADFLKSN